MSQASEHRAKAEEHAEAAGGFITQAHDANKLDAKHLGIRYAELEVGLSIAQRLAAMEATLRDGSADLR